MLLAAVVALLSSPLATAKIINVVASFSILGDIVHQIGGERVKVSTLVNPGGDPHNFEPSPQDSKLLSKADVVFVNGLGLEGWLDRLVNASGYQGPIIIASKGVKLRQIKENSTQVTDSHAWNSMKNGIQYASNVMHALIIADPQDENYLYQRGTKYILQLHKLDLWAKRQFSVVPPEKRRVLTNHDALGYFGREYGVIFLAPIGLSTASEASARDVARLIKQVKQEKISACFIENQTDSGLIKQIAAATGTKARKELYPEGLSKAHGPAETYVRAFQHNVEVLLTSMRH